MVAAAPRVETVDRDADPKRPMRRVGALKNMPATWQDLFFPDIHDLPGD